MFSNQSKYLFLAGFIVVMGLMIAVIVVGYKEMSGINHSMELVVNKYNAKTSKITIMYNAARERAIIILRMLDSEDPFERDEGYIEFNEQATRFALARIDMNELGLNETEQAFAEDQYRLTQMAMPMLDKVIELMSQDRLEEARRIMLEQALPAQDKVLAQLTSMMDYQEQLAKQSLQEAKESYENTKNQIAMLAIGAFLIGIWIAFLVTKYATRAREALFSQVTLQSIGDAVITTDAKGNINYLNPLAEKMTGWTMQEASGKPLSDVFIVSDELSSNTLQASIDDAVMQKVPLSIVNEARLDNSSGKRIAIDFSINPILENASKRIGSVLTFRNMNKERKLRQQLSYQASHDLLTALINRYEFEKRLQEVIDHSKKDLTTHSLFYVDLDEFKVVNDTCGHIAGDELLRQMALLLKDNLRSHDIIARLGGDEFGILLEDCKIEQAVTLADKILGAIQDLQFAWEDKTFRVGASIGVVEVDEFSKDINHVMAIADTACYSAKDSGRNRIHIAEKDDEAIATRRGEMQWVSVITRALETDAFQLFGQKIIAIDENTDEFGIELLLRMRHENGSLIMPDAFIPSAERYNLMVQIDRWVIRHALDWLESNKVDRLVRCAINISGQSLGDEKFLTDTKALLSSKNINCSKICFEITETAAISDLTNATRLITELKALGCRFALDDFGSGLSSFAYLKTLDVDYIKIDGMFVKDVAEDNIDKEMVNSIISIAKAMGKKTIAEYVESDAIREILKEMGVDYIQGYAVDIPVDISELVQTPQTGRTVSSTGKIH